MRAKLGKQTSVVIAVIILTVLVVFMVNLRNLGQETIPEPTEEPQMTLVVTCLNNTGQIKPPLAGVSVKIQLLGTGSKGHGETAENGQARFLLPSTGEYKVEVRKEGYTCDREYRLITVTQELESHVTFVLTKTEVEEW